METNERTNAQPAAPEQASFMHSQPQASRTNATYVLAASIFGAAVIIAGAIVFVATRGGAPSGAAQKPHNPLSDPYKGPTTAFSKCVDAKTYAPRIAQQEAAATAAGVNSTPTTFVNGVMVTSSAQDGSTVSAGANDTLIFQAIENALGDLAHHKEPAAGPFALTSDDVPLGKANAPVTVIEYGDYQCPFCTKFFTAIEPTLKQRYVDTGKVRFVFRNFAFIDSFKPGDTESHDAAAAVECAKDAGKFWEYHDALYAAKVDDEQAMAAINQSAENDGFLERNLFLNLAAQVGLTAK